MLIVSSLADLVCGNRFQFLAYLSPTIVKNFNATPVTVFVKKPVAPKPVHLFSFYLTKVFSLTCNNPLRLSSIIDLLGVKSQKKKKKKWHN